MESAAGLRGGGGGVAARLNRQTAAVKGYVMGLRLWANAAALVAGCVGASCLGMQCYAADLTPADSSSVVSLHAPALAATLPNSLFVFGGFMSTVNFGSTLVFDTFPVFTSSIAGQKYDNFIAGAAYQRDFYSFGSGFVVAGEVGIADRFGHYAVCCDASGPGQTVITSGVVNSGELWFGPAIRYESLVLFNALGVIPGFTAGFSATTNSIGKERQRELTTPGGDARFLGYLGPEIGFSLVSAPQWELVIALHHRSGANGTFGHLMEGYNANVAGLRYRF
jgi:hypothetical protein